MGSRLPSPQSPHRERRTLWINFLTISVKNVIIVKLTQNVMVVKNVHNVHPDLRVAADSARLGRTLLHARRDAGRAADSVQASRAAIIEKDKYSSCDFMCTEYIFMSTIKKKK